MANTVEILALLLGLDSLAVGFGLGTTAPRRDRLRLVGAFAACDGLASLAGWAAGAGAWRASLAWCEWVGPVAVGGYGLFVLYLAGCSCRVAERGGGRRLAFVLPACVSLDNFVTGMGADLGGDSAAVTAIGFAAASGLLALVGLWAGAAAAERARPRAGWLAGAALLLVAAALAAKDVLT